MRITLEYIEKNKEVSKDTSMLRKENMKSNL